MRGKDWPKWFNGTFAFHGNNGGDILEMSRVSVDEKGNDLIHLKVGHCCVFSIDHIVPIEVITGLLVRSVLDHGGLENAIKSIGWSDSLTKKILEQVEEK